MVAFITSIVIGLLGCAAVFGYGRRRPVGAPLTWGEAMAAACFVFFLFVWWYAIIPHQWLSLADNEWGWREDTFLIRSAGSVLEGHWWLDINMVVVRDIIAVNIYVVAVVIHVAMWMKWQNRGKERPAKVPASAYGRPLVRKG